VSDYRFDHPDVIKTSKFLVPLVIECKLGDIYRAASHKMWRVKVTVTSPHPDDPLGIDNEMAWFPADHAVFDTECISALLTTDGNLNPRSHVLGQIQIHRDHLIWLSWEPNLGSMTTIHWKNVFCAWTILHGTDEDGGKWKIALEPWYAGYPPAWPTWLLDD
jgi:hypothetical protein